VGFFRPACPPPFCPQLRHGVIFFLLPLDKLGYYDVPITTKTSKANIKEENAKKKISTLHGIVKNPCFILGIIFGFSLFGT
jgi:hypothetical protein